MTTPDQWSRHADTIESAREVADHRLLTEAIRWSLAHPDLTAKELITAADVLFSSRGRIGGQQFNNALEIVLDAYLDAEGGRHVPAPRAIPATAQPRAAHP